MEENYTWKFNILDRSDSRRSEVFPKNCRHFQWQLDLRNLHRQSCTLNLITVKAPDHPMKVNYTVELLRSDLFSRWNELFSVEGSYTYRNGSSKLNEITKFSNTLSWILFFKVNIKIVCASIPKKPAPSDLHGDLKLNVASRNSEAKILNSVVSQDFKERILNSVLMDPEFSDLKIKVGTTTFNVHKCVLGSVSTVFRAALTNDMVEKHSGCIEISDFQADVIQNFIDFIYKGQAKVTDFHMASELLRASDIYDIPALKEYCNKYFFTQVNQDNIIKILIAADIANADDLKEYAIKYFCKNHKIHNPKDFKDLLKINPDLLLILFAKLTKEHAVSR